ncbi:acyl-CoA N-acyltransferase [Mycena pura]|uniref:Acyl-CoA N-acyltransferase n=1 Tax=Mycena pura TaxID=153505 RepID=A0AAD6UV73_9AGAR|nr:acyl-CoA N-acyltransferase [Mycena pura]
MTLIEVPPLSPVEEKIVVLRHLTAFDLLAVAYPTLRRHEHSANIVLAHALARAPVEFVLTEGQFLAESDVQPPLPPSPQPVPDSNNFWLSVWSQPTKSKPVLDVVLSCLDSPLGDYPIFLWAAVATQGPGLGRRVGALVEHLAACVDPKRVFAVFGPTDLATAFSTTWARLTGFQTAADPLYNAFHACCTPQTLRVLTPTKTPHRGVRKATRFDTEAVAKLCEEFANSSEYPLNKSEATIEAKQLIDKGQLWVYETATGEIATICAVSRTSLRVSAITKVYTLPKWRRHGFARDLVQVTTQRLFECGKYSVVLYVGRDNAARRVYERIGFQMEDTDAWMEFGFVGTNAGHW